jgi:acyl carrier protein phosphodiesterase
MKGVSLNHLAHALLAGSDPDMKLGGMLADFWRGAPDLSWRTKVREGVILHRNIDVYTDSHPEVAAARNLFEPPYRRFAGVLLDIYFDHALARYWRDYSELSIDALSAQMLQLLDDNQTWLPQDLNRFARYFRSAGLFASYGDRITIERVLAGMSQRFRHDNPLASAGPVLWERAATLDATFARFFPDLRNYADARRAELGAAELT